MNSHKYADLFPMMNDVELAALVDDMQTMGYDMTTPIITLNGEILDGRNRHKAARLAGVAPAFIEYEGNDPLEFVLRHNLKRRHLNETQRAGIAAKLANMERIDTLKQNRSANLPNGKITQAQAAEKLNVGERTLRTFKSVSEAMPELVPMMENGKMSAHEAEKKVKEMRRYKQHAALVALAEKNEVQEYNNFQTNKIYLGDIRNISLPANSVDMIFTDPPYNNDSVDLFHALSAFAFHTLKPGAYLMAYTGKTFFPQVMNALGDYLEYVWTFGVFQPDSNHRIHKNHVFSTWRPIVCFKKPGKTINMNWQPDMIKGTRDKTFHEWQQQIEPALKWIEAYTLPNDLIVDPFIGGGTTAVACKQLKRNYIGFDINPESVRMAEMRLEQK